MERVVFLDRDGTINEEVNYLHKPEDFRLLPGVGEAMKLLKDAGYRIVVVTNQAGVARGYYTEADVEALHVYVNERLKAEYQIEVDAFYYCPHHPEHGIGEYKVACHCRKPETGMLEQAQEKFFIDKTKSWMIGDKILDVEAGRRFGVNTILVGTGYGAKEHQEQQKSSNMCYNFYKETLLDATKEILRSNEMDELLRRYPELACIQDDIRNAYEQLKTCYEQGGKVLIAGNGGSCADAEHIVGELMKGFVKKRPLSRKLQTKMVACDEQAGQMLASGLQESLPAIALHNHMGLNTAFSNDVNGDMIYAQQVCGYGQKGDVFLGISTSGNSKNVDYAVTVAKAKGLTVLGLTGKDGGVLGKRADVAIIVPETETYKIQELHLPIYHALCLMLEAHFFKE